ncbi:MAG: hypothetical protein M1818_007092 [Claussenomyces sp. TS43310]|nr:MAG: hypothetical protein M1818_007092 [Claussenomyces sp. TS43310]
MAVVEQFLTSISSFLRARDATKLRDWLKVEPPLPDQYYELSRELQASYRDSDALEGHIAKLVPENGNGKADEGDVWPGFLAFMKEYLEFWRDVNFDDLLETHQQLSSLVNACITALSNPSYGIIILPASVQLSTALAKLAMTLDKRPDLTRRLRNVSNVEQGGESRKTLVEGTAESIQRAFTMCLTERSANRNGIGRDGKPEGKKIGIYLFANLVLKLLFQCRKTRLANQLFTNISQHSPPLSLYPASQRVTYLYYLGRFQFSNGHFYQAQSSLQAAYDQCHRQAIRQRRLILIYLITSNLILGRIAGPSFFSRPEGAGILDKFAPVQMAIRKGDIAAFKRALGPESGNQQWFFNKGLLLPLLYRAEVIVWRSLARRVFLLTYQFPADPQSRKAPTLDLNDLVVASKYCQRILEGWQRPQGGESGMFVTSNDLVPPRQGPIKLAAHQGTLFGNQEPTILEVEAVVASLVQQGLLHGFVAHNLSRFAILGAKQRGGPLKAGFPSPWEVMKSRAESVGTEVPGWVREERKAAMGGVVNLSGIARPVGSGG